MEDKKIQKITPVEKTELPKGIKWQLLRRIDFEKRERKEEKKEEFGNLLDKETEALKEKDFMSIKESKEVEQRRSSKQTSIHALKEMVEADSAGHISRMITRLRENDSKNKKTKEQTIEEEK